MQPIKIKSSNIYNASNQVVKGNVFTTIYTKYVMDVDAPQKRLFNGTFYGYEKIDPTSDGAVSSNYKSNLSKSDLEPLTTLNSHKLDLSLRFDPLFGVQYNYVRQVDFALFKIQIPKMDIQSVDVSLGNFLYKHYPMGGALSESNDIDKNIILKKYERDEEFINDYFVISGDNYKLKGGFVYTPDNPIPSVDDLYYSTVYQKKVIACVMGSELTTIYFLIALSLKSVEIFGVQNSSVDVVEDMLYSFQITIDNNVNIYYTKYGDKTEKQRYFIINDEESPLLNIMTLDNPNNGYRLHERIASEYKNGKETATILCSISDYYDIDGNRVISTETSDKMMFDIGDIVIPYIYTCQDVDMPLSLNKDGTPKQFRVIGTRPYADGAVWQELTLLEKTV